MEDQGGSSAPRVTTENKKLQQTQEQVNEVVGIMRVNVQKVLERDQKLSELDDRADALQHGASQFEQQAGKLKRKYWWKNVKMMIIIAIIAVIFLALIIWWAMPSGGGSSSNESHPDTSTTAAAVGGGR